MKKTNLLVACAMTLLMMGCSRGAEGDRVKTIKVAGNSNYNIKVIDGCEYIEYDDGLLDRRVYSLTHKGDCTNKKHECH